MVAQSSSSKISFRLILKLPNERNRAGTGPKHFNFNCLNYRYPKIYLFQTEIFLALIPILSLHWIPFFPLNIFYLRLLSLWKLYYLAKWLFFVNPRTIRHPPGIFFLTPNINKDKHLQGAVPEFNKTIKIWISARPQENLYRWDFHLHFILYYVY